MTIAFINAQFLDGENGFSINGINSEDFAGASVSDAGDINGDGIDDLIVSSYAANDRTGETYVVFGSTSGFSSTLNLSSLDGTNGFTLKGINPGDGSGIAVSDAGDINGDSIDDLIIGAYTANDGAGETYVVFGSASGFSSTLNLSSLDGTNGITIEGIDAGDNSGFSVSSLGDINGDEIDDLIVSAYGANSFAGETYVVFGSASGLPPTLNLSSLDGTNGFTLTGINSYDKSGISVSNAGDFNGDEINDLIVGASDANSYAGESYVVFGSKEGFAATIALASLDGTNGVTLEGIEAGDYAGRSVSNAGDINGDDIDDILIGAPGNDSKPGKSYVIFGSRAAFAETISLSSLDGSNGFVIQGEEDGDNFGYSVSSAGDINGDDLDDLIIGALNANNTAGESYLIFGSATGFAPALSLSSLDGANGFRIEGINAGDASGGSVSGAGDVNDDGFDDLIVSAVGANNNTGENYVIFGASNIFLNFAFNLSSLDGNNGLIIRGIDRGDRSGLSVSNAGDINGDGIEDLAIGAPTANGEDGESYVVFGNATGFSSPINLSSLDGTSGFTIAGIRTDGNLGNSISYAGDINGDGIDDLIVAAYKANNSVGENYVIFGTTDEFSTNFDLAALDGSNGFTLAGVQAGDESGTSVSNAGDINGDNIDDLLISAAKANNGAGATYVIFGNSAGFDATVELASLNGTNGFTLTGIAENDGSGIGISNAGDVNNDKFDDLLIGASSANGNLGEVYLVFGSSAGFEANIDLATLNGTNGVTIEGIRENGFFGSSVSSAGDVNRDGIDDLIVAAPQANNGAGETYVIFGNTDATFELGSLNGSNGFAIEGINAGDGSGSSVSSAGDINGDGFDDLLIGAAFANKAEGNDFGAGESYVIFGNTEGFNGTLELAKLGSNGFTINAIGTGDFLGISVSDAGDINDDGLDDLIVGAPLVNNNRGASYVIFGSTDLGNKAETKLLFGTQDSDNLELPAPPDRYLAFSGSGNDTVGASAKQSQPDDRLYAGAGGDLLVAGTNDRLLGGNDNDTLDASSGGGGNRLYAGAGDDSLIAGFNDVLVGGTGVDRFTIATNSVPSSPNRVADFEAGVEVIAINGLTVGDRAVTFDDLTITDGTQGAEVRLNALTGDSIAIFLGITAEVLKDSTNTNFEFG
jgi:hypothetical protein